MLWPYSVIIEGEEVEQIDGALFLDGFSFLIEAKDRAGKANVEPIAKLRNQLLRRPSSAFGVVFSREGFTEPATILARFLAPQLVLLWNGEEIELALRGKMMRRGLVQKYHHALSHGFPDFNLLSLPE